MKTTKIHKTNILPLRWIANGISSPIAHYFFMNGLKYHFKHEESYDNDENFAMPQWDYFMLNLNHKIYRIFNVPYEKWGTCYKIDLDQFDNQE